MNALLPIALSYKILNIVRSPDSATYYPFEIKFESKLMILAATV